VRVRVRVPVYGRACIWSVVCVWTVCECGQPVYVRAVHRPWGMVAQCGPWRSSYELLSVQRMS